MTAAAEAAAKAAVRAQDWAAGEGSGSHARPWALAGVHFALLTLLAGAVFWPTVLSMAAVWWSTPTFHHGFAVLPVTLVLIWRKRRQLAAEPVRPEPRALAPLALGAALWLAGEAGALQLFQHAGLAVMLAALAFGVCGWALIRHGWFPLLFLGFMVPAGDQLVPLLQDVTAAIAVWLLQAAGIPVMRDGVLLQTPSGLFEVAEACAGIRFLIANIVVASVFAHLNYRRWYKAAAFMALCIVVPILANGVRGFGIMLIAYWTDNEYAAGVDHIVYGWGFFAVVMLATLYAGSLFADRPAAEAPAQPKPGPAEGVARWMPVSRAQPLVTALMALGLLAAPAYAALVLGNAPWEAPSHLTPPRAGGAWTAAPGAPGWRPVFAGATAELAQTYRHQPTDRTLAFYLAYYAGQRQGSEPIQHANRVTGGEGWTRIASRKETLAATDGPLPVNVERTAGPDGREWTLASWYWVGGRFTASRLEAKILQIKAALAGESRAAAAIVLAAETGGGAFPRALLEGFLAAAPVLPGYLRGIEASAEAEAGMDAGERDAPSLTGEGG